MTEAPERIAATYTNYKGETSTRTIIPLEIRFGVTDWHPEPQWLLRAWCEDRQAWRDFALRDFSFNTDHANALIAAAREEGFWAGRNCGGSKAEIDAALAALAKKEPGA